MKRIKTAVLAFALLAALTAAAGASAAQSNGGKIWVFVTGNGFNQQKVVVAGAIGDYGSGVSVDANGKPNQNGAFEKLNLHKGSVLIDSAKFNAAGNNPRPVLRSKRTCSAVFTWSGPVTIVGGTGAYHGVTGRLIAKGTFAGVSPRFKSGPHKGQCNSGGNVQPVALYVSVTVTGTVKLG